MPFVKLQIFILLILFSCSHPEKHNRWKGYAIIGNGDLCAVYSDDDRLNKSGIQHFYFKDYAADYIASSSWKVYLENGSEFIGTKSIGMVNFYTTSTKIKNESNTLEFNSFALPENAIILSLKTSENITDLQFNLNINFRDSIITDKLIKMVSMKPQKNSIILEWDNNTNILIGSINNFNSIELQKSSLQIKGNLNSSFIQIIIIASDSEEECLKTYKSYKKEKDLYQIANQHWNSWMNSGEVPEFDNEQYLDYYKRNLYAAKSANLNGMIPADITGQFVTNKMPQLYPRDAMMTARVFLKTGHLKEAKEIIEFWANQNIPRKSKGEWYARYDANGKTVDAGTGARYDEPEWDANGYFIQLLDMYHNHSGEWLVDSLQIYETADFLVSNLDKNNLLFEGGIIEWTGYLPATNMTAAAALKTASEIAYGFGNIQKSEMYKNASKKISDNLKFMFENKRNTYADVRFAGNKNVDNSSIQNTIGDTLYLWDTSSIFGILWGYPNHEAMQQTNDFYSKNTVKFDGGVQYFNAPNQGLSAYGNDMFFFTTAARAQYLAMNKKIAESQKHIDWMINNSNIYGLMPERIYLNNQDCSDASPLSWCCAEFAVALLELYNSSQRSLLYNNK